MKFNFLKRIASLFIGKIKREEQKGVYVMDEKKCYKNRELSWLQFNERVLNEAGNARVPLAERLSFASIYQTNLDEFFMVRVGTLMVQTHSKEEIRENKTGMTSREQVNKVLERVKELEVTKAKIYEQLMGELEPHGIRIINFNRLSDEEGVSLESYFDRNIAPYLSPIIIGKQQPFPFLGNKKLYAAVLLSKKNVKNKQKNKSQKSKSKYKIGIVACTNSVFNRLIEIPTRPGNFMLCEELILHFVSKLFQNYNVEDKTVVRVTRNADIDANDVYDEDLDYRDIMTHLIKKRTRLSPVRVEISRSIKQDLTDELAKNLEISKKHFVKSDTPLDLSFVFRLQEYLKDERSLFYNPRTPQLSPALNMKDSIIDQVSKKDVLLSYPFESMRPFLKMLSDAAEDDSVVSIKMTLYRVTDRSKIIETLIDAAENGKEVVVLVELRARFDEANNIEMSKRLEQAGCQVIYGLGDYKVHSKLCIITRNTSEGLSYITQIGTGNYNEKTSQLYTDLSLITANQEIGVEAAGVFNSLLLGETTTKTKHLLVAPNCLQNKILDMMDEQIERAKEGKPAYIGIKANSLTDKALIEKMIEASNAGVKIELIIRGICCLIPKIPGKTENITVISVVGRYLEHSRIYRFGVGEEEKIYISSADFMTRNTLRRVEVAAPIYDKEIKKRLTHIFDTVMLDTEKGKEQTCDGVYVDRTSIDERLNSQEMFYDEAYKNAERQ